MFDLKSVLSVFKGKRFIGCDMGASCVKFVQVDKTDKGCKLVKTGIIKVPDILDEGERSSQIQSFLHDKKFSTTGQVAINIENSTLLIRRMSVPKMPDRDMEIAIRWNFREFVEGSIDNYAVSYLPIKGFGDGDSKVLLSATCVSRESVENLKTVAKDAGLRVAAIEPNASALLAIFNHTIRWKKDAVYVMLDLGDSVSNFTVIGNGCLLFSRTLINLYGRKLRDNVEKELRLNEEESEKALKDYLLADGKDKPESQAQADESALKMGDIISQFISQMVVEIQRSIDAFCIMYKRDKVDKIYLSGGGLCLPQIVERLADGLGVEVTIFNPFEKFLEAETARKMVSAPMYSVAAGLALPRD